VGDLVYLERRASGVSRALDFGLEAQGAAPSQVRRRDVEAGVAAQALGRGPTTLVAFLDYRCGVCREHDDELRAGARAGRWRLLVRDWPILGSPSRLAAEAALAAGAQGGYWELHAALMRTGFVPTAALVRDLAERAGLDADRLRGDMAAPWVAEALAHNAALARALGGIGTPLYVVDGVVIVGGWSPATLVEIAERHRRAG
jgi:protein-disulfide isomerase